MKLVKRANWHLKKRRTYLRYRIFSEEDLDQEGCAFQVAVFKPGEEILQHYHRDMTEIYIVLAGTALVTVNDVGMRCEKDDVLLIEKGEWHAIKNDGRSDFIIAICKYNVNDTFLW